MRDLIKQIFALHQRELALDELSPAARVLEQRAIHAELARIETQIEYRSRTDPLCLLGRAQAQIERQLAAQGDRADPSLVRLQHDLAAFLQPQSQSSPLKS